MADIGHGVPNPGQCGQAIGHDLPDIEATPPDTLQVLPDIAARQMGVGRCCPDDVLSFPGVTSSQHVLMQDMNGIDSSNHGICLIKSDVNSYRIDLISTRYDESSIQNCAHSY